MTKKKNKQTIFVGLSGGVDSAVSVAILKNQGYNVVGVFIRTWHPDFLPCSEEEERMDAMRVATHLDIPFLTFDLADVYKKEVADYMIAEYKAGRTPNPDVMCNKEVKFGAFLKKALAMGADYVATGHYAQTCDTSSHFSSLRPSRDYAGGTLGKLKMKRSVACLYKGADPSKDQSYFLWTLKQEQLRKILFPVGHLKKSEVRILAKKFKLPVAEKKDSQGICFLGAVDLKEFLKHYIKEKKGDVIIVPSEGEGEKKNNVIGYHDGVVFHTLGERHGFTITKKNPNDGPYYIVGKDIKKNILYVSQNGKQMLSDPYPASPLVRGRRGGGLISPLTRGGKGGFSIYLKDTNWISGILDNHQLKTYNYTCQIRYHGEFLRCRVKCSKFDFEQRRAEIIFKEPVLVASGQSVVVYDKNVCLGGGVVV